MIILGLDQSSHCTGWAVFNDKEIVDFGDFNSEGETLGERLCSIKEKVSLIIQSYRVEFVVFEDIQLQLKVANNVATFKVLAEVIGMLENYLTEIKIPYKSVFSSVWRKALKITGANRAQKKKSAQMYIFNKYFKRVSEDEADALCIASYYALKDKTEDYDWS